MLSIEEKLWRSLWLDLRERGKGRKESGAFLLGEVVSGMRRISSYVLYDDLNPKALQRYMIHMPSEAYAHLWRICRARGQAVVADIHTHPKEAFFSLTDRSHPMLPEVGHIALVIAHYAKNEPNLDDVAMFVYNGSFEWLDVSAKAIEKQLIIRKV